MVTSTAGRQQHISPDGIIERLNYGVILRPQQPLRLVTDEWIHVFVSQLPDKQTDKDVITGLTAFNCSTIRNMSAASCESVLPLFNELLTLHKTSMRRVKTVIDHIYDILPESHITRRTRGLFDLGGKILRSLFGVATEDQVNAIKATARHTITENANAFHQWQKHAETMSSFMSVANHRLNNIATVVRDQQTMIQTVQQSVSRLDRDISILRTVMTSAINNLTNFISVLTELDDIRIAIESLTHGQLSPILLPPTILEHALTDLHNYLITHVSPFISILLEPTAANYYRHSSFVAARQGTKLLIAVNFPLSADHLDMTLYRIQTFRVPVPGNANLAHVTEIKNLPYGIAFRSTDPDYEYLTFQNVPTLTDNFYYFNHNPSQMLRVFSKHHTCISAIIQNQRQSVNELCHIHLHPDSLAPNILPLSPSSILVTNTTSLTFTCRRRRKTMAGCMQCRISIPCHCSLQTNSGFLPRRAHKCTPTDRNITVYHTTNLAVLQSFFTHETLGSLVGDTLLAHPLAVELPQFKFLKVNQTAHLAKDSALAYDLQRAINITREDGRVFHSLAETLWQDAANIDTVSTSESTFTFLTTWPSLHFLISSILAAIAFGAIIFLFYRIKILTATIAAMTITVQKTAALNPTLPSYISYFQLSPPKLQNSTTTIPPVLLSPTAPLNSTSTYLFALCIILLALLIYKKFRHCRLNPNCSDLLIEFGNNRDTMQLKCQTLPGSPSQYTFSATEFITNVEITGCLRKVANVEWLSLNIKNTYLNMSFKFNGRIPLCPIQAYRLHRIISGQFWSILTARYQHCLHRIEIVRASPNETVDPEPRTLRISQSDGMSALYIMAPPAMPQRQTP